MSAALIIPTIRQNSIKEFLEQWSPKLNRVQVIILEDNPEKTFDVDSRYVHFSWREIDEILGEDSWIISRKDSAIRSFGFFYASRIGCEYIFSLDDDCWPVHNDHFKKHIDHLEYTRRWTNLIDIRPRGLPYFNQGYLNSVVLNMGLWKGVPDIDAVQQLANGTPTDYEPPKVDFIVPYGQYYCLCGMNFAFKSSISVLTYFPIMGKDSPYGRFDDIWCGIILKKICDHLGLHIHVGEPIIHHKKASDVLTNLKKETPGICVNEVFWEMIDNIALKKDTPKACMIEIGIVLEKNEDAYFAKLGKAIQVWANLF